MFKTCNKGVEYIIFSGPSRWAPHCVNASTRQIYSIQGGDISDWTGWSALMVASFGCIPKHPFRLLMWTFLYKLNKNMNL